ncbi:helix-turn-helix domain-containing protein [Candidatus Clostridium stratigraminis]|uniref:Helix-turn-helix domain-containing protein n=1 Tax=Candidatus Clostridium stratigraminis TaxID=3381661 RepID=A0ABW8T280_9CLOT
MEFLNPGEKVKNIRKLLGLKQEKLEEIGVSRNFISMVEHEKRKLNKKTAAKVLGVFQNQAKELDINLDIDVKYLLTTAAEEATSYCREKLNLELSMDEIEQLIDLCNKYKIVADILPNLYMKKADILFDKTIYNEAFVEYYNALEIFKDNKDKDNKALVFNKLGKCKLNTLDFTESLAYFIRSYDLSSECNNLIIKKHTLFNLAIIYGRIDKLEEAHAYINDYISLCDSSNDLYDIIQAEVLRAVYYAREGKFNKSIDTYLEILVKETQIKDATLALIYNNLGSDYLEINDLENSIECFNRAQHLRETRDASKLCRTLIDKSKVFIKNKLSIEAIKLLNEGLDMAIIYSDLEYIISGFNLLEEIYTSLHDDNALNLLYTKVLYILKGKASNQYLANVYTKICLNSLIHDSKNEKSPEFKNKLIDLSIFLNKSLNFTKNDFQ